MIATETSPTQNRLFDQLRRVHLGEEFAFDLVAARPVSDDYVDALKTLIGERATDRAPIA